MVNTNLLSIWDEFRSSFFILYNEVEKEQNMIVKNRMEMEDLSWVVSWDQQFLNEFNKVLFSESLVSEMTLFEQVYELLISRDNECQIFFSHMFTKMLILKK